MTMLPGRNPNDRHGVRAFQAQMAGRLVEAMSQAGLSLQADPEWSPLAGQGRSIYSPHVDIAVSPYAIERSYSLEYDEMVHNLSASGLLEHWATQSQNNQRQFLSHFEPRWDATDLPTFVGARRSSMCVGVRVRLNNRL
jgi:hypothetical protein